MDKLKVTNDYVFKRIFAKQGNESILNDFLIAVLELPIEKIEVIKTEVSNLNKFNKYLERDNRTIYLAGNVE